MRKMADQPDSEGTLLEAFGERWNTAGFLLLMEKNPITARYCIILKKSPEFFI